ncbi:MAG: leucyl/phenylalanyl-tRNA--protein transferase [Parahaliea sp.]
MNQLRYLEGEEDFPPTCEALDDPNGLLAIGGDLSPSRLLQAYRQGIFPWYNEYQPILWWSPEPRSVLLPDELHISRSLRKTLRKNHFYLGADTAFADVMNACAELRPHQEGTWISADMTRAYGKLFHLGHAHSIEVRSGKGELVGGLYGVSIGGAFFGESMFSRTNDASKVALVALVWLARQRGIGLIDCQIESEHLNSMGARNLSRLDFENRLAQTVHLGTGPLNWHLPATCGDLL